MICTNSLGTERPSSGSQKPAKSQPLQTEVSKEGSLGPALLTVFVRTATRPHAGGSSSGHVLGAYYSLPGIHRCSFNIRIPSPSQMPHRRTVTIRTTDFICTGNPSPLEEKIIGNFHLGFLTLASGRDRGAGGARRTRHPDTKSEGLDFHHIQANSVFLICFQYVCSWGYCRHRATLPYEGITVLFKNTFEE